LLTPRSSIIGRLSAESVTGKGLYNRDRKPQKCSLIFWRTTAST
jgi:hypothetical protein